MSRQQLRAEEIEAIQKAIEIMSSKAVSGHAETHLPTLLQKSSSLTQVQTEEQSAARARAIMYLQTRGKQLNSQVLATLASHMADDPFRKVKKMIKDLIVCLITG